MASTLWGKVYYHDQFSGILQQEPGGRYDFTYNTEYLERGGRAIAHTLPLQEEPHFGEGGLHPFFDNLVAEGWLRNAQARALGSSTADRFALLLAFGRDCAGAVTINDPAPAAELKLDAADQESIAALTSRASLSGIQPKILAIKDARGFRPAKANENSSHIAKLPSGQLPDMIALEWLTTEATRKLLPKEPVPDMEIVSLGDIANEALLIRRFDRPADGTKLHFEEFNQLLGKRSENKYDGNYEDMATFIRTTDGCIPAEAERLFRRVLTCLLTGNSDAHLKNFAMFHTTEGLRLAPSYDLLASSYYSQFDTLALGIAGARDLPLSRLRAKNIVLLGKACELSAATIQIAAEDLGKRLDAAKAAIDNSQVGTKTLREGIITIMERRWNGIFASIGQFLSKKLDGAAKHRV